MVTRNHPFLLVILALAAACSAPGDGAPDAGATPDAATDGTTDAGEPDAGEPVDAGPETCDPATFPEAGEPCSGVTDGACNPGTRFCDSGFVSTCFFRSQPVAGDCTQRNCLGELNTGCECLIGRREVCYEGPEGTEGKGTCRAGFRECRATATGTAWSDCEGQVLPQPDDCSTRDLDCDSLEPTEGCTCTNEPPRPCGGFGGTDEDTCELGTQRCVNGRWGVCDGAVQPQAGACDRSSCLGGPNPGCECVFDSTAPETEPCYTGLAGTSGVGTCGPGARTCTSSGRWGPLGDANCVGETRPVPNLCDAPSCTGGANPGCE